MKEQMTRIHMAGEQLAGVCAELEQLARRIESIRNSVLTATADAAAVATQTTTCGASTPPTVRKVLPQVQGLRTRPEVIAKVKAALRLNSRKEAEIVAGAVIGALEETLAENIGRNGFSIKLGSFGKLSIRHRLGTLRRIPLTGETRMTSTKRKVKFVAIGRLRQLERVDTAR